MTLCIEGTVFVAGHNGMVGSAIMRSLQKSQVTKVVTASREELNLLDFQAVATFFTSNNVGSVFLAAAKVGGIYANNTYPADFIYHNLMIEASVIHAAHLAGVKRLLFLGSSCIYPRDVEQPIKEEALLSGPLEATNEPYAIAKIAGIKLCESYNRQYGCDYRSVMPTNLYGPNDNFHPENSHVVPALLRRFHEAVESGSKEILIWGTGKPKREFLHVDDMAEACMFVMQLDRRLYQQSTTPTMSHLNVGSGVDCTIRELAEMIAEIVGFKGKIHFDASKPDGTPRKLLDVSKLSGLGWDAKIDLKRGLINSYDWYVQNAQQARSK